MKLKRIEAKPQPIFNEKIIKTLVLITNYVDELIETLDIMSNHRLMKKITEEEWKRGRIRDLEAFLKEVR